MLTQAQKDAFDRDGVLVIPDVVTDQLPALRAEYAAALEPMWQDWHRAGKVGSTDAFEDRVLEAYKAGCEWFQPLDISLPLDPFDADVPFHAGPAVFGLMRHPRLLDLVEDIIGPEISSVPIQHVRIKPPVPDLRDAETRAHIAATDWHQDRGVTQEVADETTMITAWVAITDATEENGCLQAVTGAHRGDLLPHCPLPQVGIPGEHIDAAHIRPLPVPAGGVVIFHPMTPHASLQNRSNAIRWSFDLRYCITGQPTGRGQFPDFVARSRRAPETELRDAAAWKTLWEDTRTRLARAPVQEYYRWDHDAPYCA